MKSQDWISEHAELELPTEVTGRTEKYISSLRDIQPCTETSNELKQCDEQTDNLNDTGRAFVQYICRQDIINDRLQIFDGKHENYLSWKQTFKSVESEIGTSNIEELDLLLRWAGQKL